MDLRGCQPELPVDWAAVYIAHINEQLSPQNQGRMWHVTCGEAGFDGLFLHWEWDGLGRRVLAR